MGQRVRRWLGRAGDARVEVTPIATPASGQVRVEVTNTGDADLLSPSLVVRPAPVGVRAQWVAAVVPRASASTVSLGSRLEGGDTEGVELDCPLHPGPLYRRVLALDPDDDEPVYGLPIETLLSIEVYWHERALIGRRRRMRTLVRGTDYGPFDAPNVP